MSQLIRTIQRLGDETVVTVLTLDRADRGNALGEELVAELANAVAEAASSRMIVLRASGRNFCTGFDLSNLTSESDADLLLRFVRVESLLQSLAASPVPTLALAHGRTFGAGADLFAVCDYRICLPNTTFAFPGPNFGLILGNRRLAERVGRDAARNLLLSGRPILAEEAMRIGLVTTIAEEGDIESIIADAARTASRLEASTVRAIRQATLTEAADTDLAQLVRSAMRPGLQKRIAAYATARRSL
jgi:enoyl-CoA hydratase/carnithine racemase